MLANCKDTTFFRFRKNFFSTNVKKITRPKQGLILPLQPPKMRPPHSHPKSIPRVYQEFPESIRLGRNILRKSP